MVQILIRPPEALKEKLKCEAQRMGITLNAMILQILWEWVESRKQVGKEVTYGSNQRNST